MYYQKIFMVKQVVFKKTVNKISLLTCDGAIDET